MESNSTVNSDKTFFLVCYRDPNDGKIQSLKAKQISDSTLGLGFVMISDFIFNTDSIVVQPIEEQMRLRFENVKSFHLSIYNVISIEEIGMKHIGLNFKRDRSNLLNFPNDIGGPPPAH